MIGVSRLTYSMGQHRQLPERIRALHPKYRTPYIAIIIFGLIACLTIVPGQADFLGKIYAFGAMLSFTIAHIAVSVLRVTEPDVERPYRIPGSIRFRGVDLPLLSVIGGLATGLSFVVLSVLNIEVLISGVVWLAIGVTGYVLYRRSQHLSLTETAKIVLPKAIVEHEVEYESVLVAFEQGNYSQDAIGTAAKLAARRRRGIHVLVTITVPANTPIGATLPEAETKAQEAIDSARVYGGRRVTGHWEKVRAGEAGRRILKEAKEIRARAIVMPMPPRRIGQSSVFGPTLETVLAERPCRVIINSVPSKPQLDRT